MTFSIEVERYNSIRCECGAGTNVRSKRQKISDKKILSFKVQRKNNSTGEQFINAVGEDEIFGRRMDIDKAVGNLHFGGENEQRKKELNAESKFVRKIVATDFHLVIGLPRFGVGSKVNAVFQASEHV